MWGSQIREARLQLDWTIADLARAVGVSYRTIIRWEHDQNFPAPEVLQKLANVTGTILEVSFHPRRFLDPYRLCSCGRILPPRRRRWCSDSCPKRPP
ncbi:MAG: helix-turn-helix transcriptional regulator [Armatimonadetes bacterium]|nr:helix-turn-helix transcriptional regulator [Armatimonadota bacterium]